MIDAAAIARDTAALVQVPSLTGDERAALERLGELADALGLSAELHEYDLAALRAHPDHPGEEAARDELLGLAVTVPGTRPGRIARLRPRRRRRRRAASRGATGHGRAGSRTATSTAAARST